ncbi:MAG: hypothetical protein ACQEWM_09770 [Actinomycetota bacterium]
MGIELPPDLPAWLGWILFGATALLWLLTGLSKLRTESTARDKSGTEALKLRLDMLSEQAENYKGQLTAMSDVLQADARDAPTDSEIDAVAAAGATGNLAYASTARHLRARAEARTRLPDVLARLSNVQARQMELMRDLALGVTVEGAELPKLRADLDGVAREVTELVKELSISPRITVGWGPPPEHGGRNGDLYLRIPGDPPSDRA